ncbi:hypothetical protein [Streptomyces griseoluteus]|uniref:hypothetical protein n=1 Tax=Streptomyces griseoluteus TaxID=29306 RepID=UPI0036F81304
MVRPPPGEIRAGVSSHRLPGGRTPHLLNWIGRWQVTPAPESDALGLRSSGHCYRFDCDSNFRCAG